MSRKFERQPRRLTRREKAAQERDVRFQRIKEAETESEYAPIPKGKPPTPITPANPRQEAAIDALSRGTSIVILTGSAGTGKSLIAAQRAATEVYHKRVQKVYLVRPAVSVGKSVGMLPGDIDAKLGPYFRQTIDHLSKFLGKTRVEAELKSKKIEMLPTEYLRGMSFEDCIVIAEECQNFTSEEMEMMLTRLGKGGQIIFTGDTKQNDLKTESGLKTTEDLLDWHLQNHPEYLTHEDLDALDDGVTIVKFRPEDCVRSGLTLSFVKIFHYDNPALRK